MKRIISLNTIIILNLLFLFCFMPGFTSNAHAATITVTNNNDSGAGSLRQTIVDASSGDEIMFAPGLAGGTITLTTGQLFIDKNLTITGPDAALTLSGNDASRVFYIGAGTDVTISNLTIIEGNIVGSSDGTDAYGGGIYSLGNLTLQNCTVRGNYANGRENVDGKGFIAYGGGIYNSLGILTLHDCIVSGNSAKGGGWELIPCGEAYGGGIYNDNGTLTLQNCTISSNSSNGSNGDTPSSGYGGGIYNDSGILTLQKCTVSNNSTKGGAGTNGSSYAYGGGIYNLGNMSLENSTVSGNSAKSGIYGNCWSKAYGGGIYNGGNILTLENCTVSSNLTTGGGGHDNETDSFGGGGIYNGSGMLTLDNCTINSNSANIGDCMGGTGNAGFGGGVYNNAGANLNMTNTIIANSRGGDCYNTGGIGTNITNWIEDNSCSPDFYDDPLLGPLQDNGGQTWTHKPKSGSGVINSGTDNGLATDQRGVSRIANRPYDIGSVELRLIPADPIISGNISGDQGGVAGVMLSFSNNGGNVTTDSNGNYSHIVTYGWSGTVIPEKTAWVFSPEYRTYNSVKANMTGQDYRAYTISLSLQAVRKTESAWIVSGDYGEITIGVDNPGNIPVLKYTLYRKVYGGAYSAIHEFSPSDINNTYVDKFLDKGKTYTYKVAATGNDGTVLAVSGEQTI